MANNPLRVVLDSNILISAYVFGGKPESVLQTIVSGTVQGITSQILISELIDVLRKKFNVSKDDLIKIKQETEELFEIVYPLESLDIIQDKPDNRVLEAAVEGECDFIISGDNDLLDLGNYKKIKILTADEFLSVLKG